LKEFFKGLVKHTYIYGIASLLYNSPPTIKAIRRTSPPEYIIKNKVESN